MSASPNKSLPQGFETWSAREKVDYIEQLWDVVLQNHSLDELPVPAWQLDAAHEAWITHERDPSTSRDAKESIRSLRERITKASRG